MDISIVIPNFNGANLLKENLPKVFAAIKDYKKGKAEIIITDDASTDNSKEIVEKFINSVKDKNISVKLLTNTNIKERGFSKNVNRAANASSGEILILLNTDVIPYKNFLEPLLKHFEDLKVFAVGCLDESIEGGKTILRGRGVGKWQKGFLEHSAGKLDKTNTLWVAGGSGAFRKSVWDKLGGLNELYNPFYWEDVDLSYRALKAGYDVCFEQESKVIHEHSKGAIKTQTKPLYVQKIAYRNQFLFVWLNITDINLILNHIFWLPYYLVLAIKNKNKAFLFGLIEALKNISQVWTYKQKIRKMFIKTDKDVLVKV